MTCLVEPLLIAGVLVKCWNGQMWLEATKVTCSTKYEQSEVIVPKELRPVKIDGSPRWLCTKEVE